MAIIWRSRQMIIFFIAWNDHEIVLRKSESDNFAKQRYMTTNMKISKNSPSILLQFSAPFTFTNCLSPSHFFATSLYLARGQEVLTIINDVTSTKIFYCTLKISQPSDINTQTSVLTHDKFPQKHHPIFRSIFICDVDFIFKFKNTKKHNYQLYF